VPGYEIEVRLRHKKGHYLWVLDRGRVVERDSQGHPLRMTGTHRDVTARKEAELALEIRNRVAEAFLTSNGDELFTEILTIICAALETPFGLFSTLDPQANLQIVATTPQTETTTDLIQDDPSFHRDALPGVLDTLINQGRYVLKNDGVKPPDFPLYLNCLLGVPISNRQQILGAVFVGDKKGGLEQSDRLFLESLAGYIAPLLQAHLNSEHKETQLRQAQKMEALGSLAGGIAHDFNNILQAIMGFTTLALEDAGPEGHLPGDLQRVLKATRRGQELVQRILLFSRRDEKKHEPVLVENVVQEALNLLQHSIPATIQINARLDAPGAQVIGDPSQISQVILNLATNAYHAMDPDGGILDVELSLLPGDVFHAGRPETLEGQDLVVLAISDNGTGMSDSVKARLFDPFFTTKEVGQGTGLGMSMVHGIVQDHDGEILVHSELEIGTTVTVFLPQLSATETCREAPAALVPGVGPQAHGHRHVALVDDEEDITDLGAALLERAGYQVTALNNGQHILDLVEINPGAFDLVVTDLTMPQITGLQLARKLEESAPSIPVLLITGMTEERALDLQSYPNIKGLIRKPFGREVLLGQVDSILRQFNPVEGS
jgi:signal transduction histidine kinase